MFRCRGSRRCSCKAKRSEAGFWAGLPDPRGIYCSLSSAAACAASGRGRLWSDLRTNGEHIERPQAGACDPGPDLITGSQDPGPQAIPSGRRLHGLVGLGHLAGLGEVFGRVDNVLGNVMAPIAPRVAHMGPSLGPCMLDRFDRLARVGLLDRVLPLDVGGRGRSRGNGGSSGGRAGIARRLRGECRTGDQSGRDQGCGKVPRRRMRVAPIVEESFTPPALNAP
jgi:hypothetical protein